MGTSQSSKGPPSSVPMVPPWVPDIPLPAELPEVEPLKGTPDAGVEQDQTPQIGPPQPIPIAPARRFGNARRRLGEFARYGDRGSMRNGVGSYVKSGYGGSKTATRRFGGTTQTANALYSALAVGADNLYTAPGRQLDPVLMAGRSADDVMDAVVEAIRPVDGTQDTEASRTAIKDALAEALTRFPDADLLNLENQQREFVIESYVTADVFRRFDMDLGKTIRDKAPSAITGLGRLKEVREYIRETVAASFRKLRNDGQQMVAGRIAEIVQNALYETFRVFEEYAE
jgi:hypothetical protein